MKSRNTLMMAICLVVSWALVLPLFGCNTEQGTQPSSAQTLRPLPTPTSTQQPSPTPEELVYFEVEKIDYTSPYLHWPLNDGVILDFDSDGDLDFLAIQIQWETWEPSPAYAFENDGKGNFEDKTSLIFKNQLAYSIGINALVAADFNGDGRDDVYLGDQGMDKEPWGGNQNTIIIQTEDGYLENQTEERIPNLSEFTHDITIGDVDSDGDIDIYNCNIAGGPSGPHLYVNDGNGYFSDESFRLPPGVTSMDRKFTSSRFVDVDQDNDMDLLLGNHGGAQPDETAERDVILENDGNGYFEFAPESSMPLRYGGSHWGVNKMATGDFNSDGWPDLIMAVHHNYETSFLQFLLNNGDGTFYDATERIPQEASYGVFGINVADINNDGWLDFVVGSDAEFKIYVNTGDANFIDASEILPISRPNIRPILPGDIDQDGDIDFVIFATDYFYYIARNVNPYIVGSEP